MNIKRAFQSIAFINEPYTRWKWRERRTSWGEENPDKTFFIVRRASCKVGLFSLVMTNMGLVRYALEMGYIPVIDMKSGANTYLEEEEVGKKNAWEFYFEQPCGYTLEDVANSKNIILSDGMITDKNVFPTYEIARNEEEFQMWHSFFREYLHVKQEIREEAEAVRRELFAGGRVLGVLCRGTDYVQQRPKNHPIQPQVEEMIGKASEVMEQYDCAWIYLATEDEGAFRKFSQTFGDRLKVTQAGRCENIGNRNINDISYGRDRERYLKGKEYLINIILLAECDCIVAGSAGGTYGAMLMNENYEYRYVYDLGVY